MGRASRGVRLAHWVDWVHRISRVTRRAVRRGPILGVLLLSGCQIPDREASPSLTSAFPPTVQGLSWTGQPLTSRAPTSNETQAILDADLALAGDPASLSRLVAAARAREVIWRYGEALKLYEQAFALFPTDFEPPLAMGHRLIRLRRLDEGLASLEKALQLDPTGFNTAYLRGLTLYLLGRFDAAADEYLRCLRHGGVAGGSPAPRPSSDASQGGELKREDPRQCLLLASDPASRVAMTSWAVRALWRADRSQEAQALLDDLPAEFDPGALRGALPGYEDSPIVAGDNNHYWTLLRFFRGDISEEVLLDRERWGGQWPTVAYGLATWWIRGGRLDEARGLLEEIVADPNWARLGHTAAEADLVRLTGTGP